MKYAFVKLVNEEGTIYMEPWQFDYYSDKQVFKDHAKSLCIFENIYIGCFPLLVQISEIKKYNDDAKLIYDLPLPDYFKTLYKTNVNNYAKKFNCDNTR